MSTSVLEERNALAEEHRRLVVAIAAGLGGLTLGGQAVNVVLHLQMQNAILKSEGKVKEWVRREFVEEEVCALRRGCGE